MSARKPSAARKTSKRKALPIKRSDLDDAVERLKCLDLSSNLVALFVAIENLANEGNAFCSSWREAKGHAAIDLDTRYDEIEEHRNTALQQLRFLRENAQYAGEGLRNFVQLVRSSMNSEAAE